jgi:hypothetical protein
MWWDISKFGVRRSTNHHLWGGILKIVGRERMKSMEEDI